MDNKRTHAPAVGTSYLSAAAAHFRAAANDICVGIAAELKETKPGIPFDVIGVDPSGGVVKVILDPDSGTLDESLEESTVKWADGEGEVVSVLPEAALMNIILRDGQLPRLDRRVWVHLPPFLKSLLELWQSDEAAGRAMNCRAAFDDNPFNRALVPRTDAFPELREGQQKAFELLGHRAGFLWGPPGTGKTFVLGRMIAAYLTKHSSEKVLLLSTTNTATDEAIQSVDDGFRDLKYGATPTRCFRFGARFNPERYAGREHLIPVRDKGLISEYRMLMANGPPPAKALDYKEWKDKIHSVRHRIQDETLQFLSSSRLAAMTATYASGQAVNIGATGPWDLVVFDEASQLSLAHALMIAGFGRRVLFAGDPKQLSPIVQSSDESAQRWLGKSPFEYMSLSGAVKRVLHEQSRMAPEICLAVSTLFYDDKLRVAPSSLRDQGWQSHRKVQRPAAMGQGNVVLLKTRFEADPVIGSWGSSGYFCDESAQLVAAVAMHLATRIDEKDILILTPYRAQRAKIANLLSSEGRHLLRVSTVHRAQGSERRIVILDPVRPSAKFLKDEDGNRLLNVAMSRSQGLLVVILHPDYPENRTLSKLAELFPSAWTTAAALGLLPRRKHRNPGLNPVPFESATSAVSTAIGPDPTVQLRLNLLTEFKEELLQKIRSGSATKVHRRWAEAEMAGKAKYAKLGWTERDAAIEDVRRDFPG